MNIKDFLIDNYIWILVVILLTIITIIGFLADKKKGKKESDNVNTSGNNYSNANPINYQNAGMSSPVNYQQNMNPNNQNMGGINIPNPMGVPNNPANFQTIPNSSLTPNNVITQPSQTNQINDMSFSNNQGNFANNSVSSNLQVGGSGIIPSPAPTPQPLDQFNDMNIGSSPVNQINVIPNNNPQPIENVNNNNLINAEPIYQPLSEQKPVIAPREVPNFPQNQVVNDNQILSSTVGVLQPEPVNQQVNMNYQQPINNQLNQQPPVNTNPTVGNTIPSPVQNPNVQNDQPVNFVYGPQNNNNNNNFM